MVYRPAKAAFDGLYRVCEPFPDAACPGHHAVLDARHFGDNILLEVGHPLANVGDGPAHAGAEGRGEAVAAVYPSEE